MTKMLLAAAGYVVIVFPLALGWHLGLFKEKYETFGYFAGEPNVLAGLAAIVIQGVVLALIYPLFRSGSAGFVRAFQFAGLMGLFFWTYPDWSAVPGHWAWRLSILRKTHRRRAR